MKKEMNGKSRRKWVVGGAMVFGSIALLSTGFATWVIGAINNTADQEITVGVDTVKNSSIDVKIVDKKDVSITLGDDVGDYGFVKVEFGTTNRDLVIELELEATFTENYGLPGEVTAKFKDDTNYVSAGVINKVHEGNTPAWTERSGSKSFGSITDGISVLADSVTVTKTVDWSEKAAVSGKTGMYTSKATVKCEFTIGDIWGTDKIFAKLVDGIYKNETKNTDLLYNAETQMNAELNKLVDLLNGKLTVTLTVEHA